jgi:hypothetical protein
MTNSIDKGNGEPNTPFKPKGPPNDPEKNIPVKKDDDNDFTKPKPIIKDPEKTDPTIIEEPNKVDPTRIDVPPEPGKEGNLAL